jgi:hypothetical protein
VNRIMPGPIPLNCCAASARAYQTESDPSPCILCRSLLSVHLANNVVLTLTILLAMPGATQHPATFPASLLVTPERSSQRCIATLDPIPRHRMVPHVTELRAQKKTHNLGSRICRALAQQKNIMHLPRRIRILWNDIGLSLFPALSLLEGTHIQVGHYTTIPGEWASLCSIRSHTLA